MKIEFGITDSIGRSVGSLPGLLAGWAGVSYKRKQESEEGLEMAGYLVF